MSDLDSSLIKRVPPEILTHIFNKLNGYDCLRCRAVCRQWLNIIQGLKAIEDLWRDVCKRNFHEIYESAHRRSSGLYWYYLFKSLRLWPKLRHARHWSRDFDLRPSFKYKVVDFVLLSNKEIGVHRTNAIVYYDNMYLKRNGKKILGNYVKYRENQDFIVLLSHDRRLSVTWKSVPSPGDFVLLQKVMTFVVSENIIYYVTYKTFTVYYCNLEYDTNGEKDVPKIADMVTLDSNFKQLSVRSKCLHLLIHSNIFGLDHRKCTHIAFCGLFLPCMFDKLRRYDFLKYLNYELYLEQYASVDGVNDSNLALSQQFSIIFTYGLVTFVGTVWGKLYVFHTQEIKDFTDLCKAEPIKVYTFVESEELLVKKCPIIKVDIIEQRDGHQLFVAMPNRIVVLNISHRSVRDAFQSNPRDYWN